jgi:hypothetical protein
MLTHTGNTFNILHNGERWYGTWRLEGDELHIESEYGSQRVENGGSEPQKLAEAVLSQIVTVWTEDPARAAPNPQALYE